jgi:hypothetical protein
MLPVHPPQVSLDPTPVQAVFKYKIQQHMITILHDYAHSWAELRPTVHQPWLNTRINTFLARYSGQGKPSGRLKNSGQNKPSLPGRFKERYSQH